MVEATTPQLGGIHHLTAVSADAPGNLAFYTRVLGMRLVKKTVNQDDVSAYHLFYADGKASPGTDLTFFDWPTGRERRGSNSVVRTALRVNGAPALEYWRARFDELAVAHGPVAEVDGRTCIAFEDPEGQRLALVDDGGVGLAGAAAAPGPQPRPNHHERAAVGADRALRDRNPRNARGAAV